MRMDVTFVISWIFRLVADGNSITLSDEDVEILKKNFSKLKYL